MILSMLRSTKSPVASLAISSDELVSIRRKLARAMVGSTVDLLANHSTIVHGIVASVSVSAGEPKIIVNGRRYDLDQVITATANSVS